MGRRMPPIYLNHIDDVLTDHQIIECNELWQLLYKGELFVYRETNLYRKCAVRYNRTTYPHRAPAENMRDKLNKRFNCTDFTVKQIA